MEEVYGTGSWESNCKKCGKPIWYIGDVPTGGFPKGLEPWCTCVEKITPTRESFGWVCPSCGSVYSPYVFKCPDCPKGYASTTYIEFNSGVK